MKKESFVAIVLGIIFGILCAFILIQLNKDKNKVSRKMPEKKTITIPTSKVQQPEFSINTPKENSVTSNDTIVVTGTAPKSAILLITSNQQEYVNQTEQTKFSQTVSLREGENIISVRLINKGIVRIKTITVFYIPV